MKDIPSRYPHFDHFLNTEFYQDADDYNFYRISNNFYNVYGAKQVTNVISDIDKLLQEQHNDIEVAFTSFRPQIYPPGWGLTTTEWLHEVAAILSQRLKAGGVT